MNKNDKTREQLLKELEKSNKRIVELEKSEIERKQAEEKLKAANQQLQATEQQLMAANQQLTASKEKYRNLYNNSPDMYVSVSPDDGSILQCNTMLLEKTGYSSDEVIGSPIFKMYHDDCIDDVKTTFQQFVETGSIKDKELILKRKDGSKIDVSLNVDAIRDESGKILHSVSSWRDITERKEVEEVLRESERRYRILFESSLNGIAYSDLDGSIIECNQAYLDLTNHTMEEMKRLQYQHLTPMRWSDVDQKHVCQALDRGYSYIYEKEHIHKDGTVFPISIRIWVREDEAGHPVGLWGIVRDTTERKRAEEKLKESEKKYRSLFENIPDGFALHKMVFDNKGKPVDYIFLEANEAFELQTGLKNKDIIGKKVTDVLPGIKNDPANWIQRYGEVVLTGENIFFENYSKPLKKWYSVVAYRPVENQFATLFTDITDRKKNELELQQSHKQLRELTAHLEDVREEERTIIARNIHDELGQLATALKMDVSWLQKQLPKENQQWIVKTQTISDLVDMTANEIQRICSELRPVVLEDLGLEDALKWYVSEYNKRTGTVCELSIEYDLARLNEHLSVAAYRMIQEALTNVQRHAKASKVTISIKGENGKLKVSIKDNGIGINKENIDDSKSFGLIGIEERALSLNGYSRISGRKGEGTTLEIMLGIGEKTKK